MGAGVRHLLLGSALAFAAVTACYTGPSANDGFLPTDAPADPATASEPTDPATLDGLPCDVAEVLANNCLSCHGDALEGDAKTHLRSRDELRSKYRGQVLADLALARIRDVDAPMPPDGSISDGDLAVLEKWIDDGMPAGSCGGSTGDDDDVAPKPVKLTCTSGTRWTRGNHESPLMKPGSACIHCHLTGSTLDDRDDDDDDDDDEGEKGPLFYFAGTVYPAAHDEDDCNGSDATDTTTVVLTGADGKVLELPINRAGNFYTKTALAMPVKAKVVSAAGTRTMKDPVDDGDCNKCHTAESKSPGRIVEKR